MFTWIKNLSVDLDKMEDMFSRKQILRSTASGMHTTANKMRSAADYIDSKASMLEAKADQLEMEEFAKEIEKRMKEDSTQDVVAIPASKLGSMPNDEIYNTLGIQINGVTGTAY